MASANDINFAFSVWQVSHQPEEGGHAHVHAENISREPIRYSTKSALTGLSGVH